MKMKVSVNLKALEPVKKYWLSITFGVVAVLAVVASFWPIGNMYAQMQKTELLNRIAAGQQLDQLLSAPHNMPILDPDQSAPAPLKMFPSSAVIDAGKQAAALVGQQASAMSDALKKANQHTPLYPGALPKPDYATQYQFAQKYVAETTNYARWQKILNSAPGVKGADVTARLGELRTEIFAKYGVAAGPEAAAGTGTAAAAAAASLPAKQAEADFESQATLVPAAMQTERANQCAIYLELPAANAGPIPYDATISVRQLPTAEQIWDAQLNVWIVDDITQAIAQVNQNQSDPGAAQGGDVLHSAIKRLEKIEAIAPVYGTAADQTSGNGGPTPRETSVSPTGRVCNAIYDVMKFKVTLVVDATKIPQILREFQRGQLITIWNVQIDDVLDPAIEMANGYTFGDKPLVRIEITGEDLLLRDWSVDLMPDSRKNAIGGGVGGGLITPTPGGGGGGGVDQGDNN
jgi:hypothetical protein